MMGVRRQDDSWGLDVFDWGDDRAIIPVPSDEWLDKCRAAVRAYNEHFAEPKTEAAEFGQRLASAVREAAKIIICAGPSSCTDQNPCPNCRAYNSLRAALRGIPEKAPAQTESGMWKIEVIE